MKHELFQPEAELLDALIAEPSAILLRRLVLSRLSRVATPFVHDECFTFGIFDDLMHAVTPSGAFTLLPAALDVAHSEKSLDRFTCALALVATLAQHSDTTQQPSALLQLWPEFIARVSAFSSAHDAALQLQSIKDWYRIQ